MGTITGNDGSTISIGVQMGTWILNNPFNRPGVLRFQTRLTSSIVPTDQGIYTCIIPDSVGNLIVINVGLYPIEFNGELYSVLGLRVDDVVLSPATDPPIILDLTYQEENRTLTCVSTVSPATTVSWMKDGQPLTTDGSSYYTLTQTVTDRNTSTYSNVLTVSNGTGVAGTYNCTVTNDLGFASRVIVALGEFRQ